MIAGAAYLWRDLLGFFSGLSRKFTDQAKTMEKTEHLRRVAQLRHEPRDTSWHMPESGARAGGSLATGRACRVRASFTSARGAFEKKVQ